jgi:hypothetical protein
MAEKMAIVVDFETNMAGEYFVLGYRHGADFQQVILDPRLQGLTDYDPYQLRYMSPTKAAQMILQKATDTDSPIAGYTTADRKYLEELIGPLPIEYVNIHTTAKKWINRHFYKEFRKDNSPPDWALKNVASFINFPAERDYARGQTTNRINSVIKGLAAKKGKYEKLTQVQKTKATKLLKHNEFDINAAHLLLQIDLSSRDKKQSLDLISQERQALETLIDTRKKKQADAAARSKKASKVPLSNTPSKVITENANIASQTGGPKPPRDLLKLRENHPTAYQRWTEEEETELKRLHQNGLSLEEIGAELGRQVGGVKGRLAKLGIINHWAWEL